MAENQTINSQFRRVCDEGLVFCPLYLQEFIDFLFEEEEKRLSKKIDKCRAAKRALISFAQKYRRETFLRGENLSEEEKLIVNEKYLSFIMETIPENYQTLYCKAVRLVKEAQTYSVKAKKYPEDYILECCAA